MMSRKYGWIKQKLDKRDFKFCHTIKETDLPALVDLRPRQSPVTDQGSVGCCVAQGTCNAFEAEALKQNESSIIPLSRLFLYYVTRVSIEGGDPTSDSGAEVRDGLKAINAFGTCINSLWNDSIVLFSGQPTQQAYDNALTHESIQYSAVNQDLISLKACLFGGYPIVFGATLYPEFESDAVAATGIVPMPDLRNDPIGGHCQLITGYDDSKQLFIIKNSWGTFFGDNGYDYMPYTYITDPNLCSDFWQIQTVK